MTNATITALYLKLECPRLPAPCYLLNFLAVLDAAGTAMAPKKANAKHGLGRALMNHRAKTRLADQQKELHSTEVYDNKPVSVTDENDLDAFLNTATLAGASFTAERQNVAVITPSGSRQHNPYLLTPSEQKTVSAEHRAHAGELRVPRRPPWSAQTTPTELERQERDSFLEWRRSLAELTDARNLLLTPFERNLEVWRQLWRVLERSQLVVQIIDARNPLRFRCEDLEKYVEEQSGGGISRRNLLLLNKADLLTDSQRKIWADYLDGEGTRFAFFSAKDANDALQLGIDGSMGEAMMDGISATKDAERTRVLSTDELEELFMSSAPRTAGSEDNSLTVGLVGYPNVGKSSTINALIGAKKVSVSSTPGKTKHFQTINLSTSVTLCDCPGLVFPNFASTRAELVCDGVLPIDQMREYTGPAALVAQRIPRNVIEATYGIRIDVRPTEEGGDGTPTASELLSSYARARGFFTSGAGQPDESRAARIILKDYVNARLLFCHPPPVPGLNPTAFNEETSALRLAALAEEHPGRAAAETTPKDCSPRRQPPATKTAELDMAFFRSSVANSRAAVAGRWGQGLVGSDGSILSGRSLPPPAPEAGKKHFKGRRGRA